MSKLEELIQQYCPDGVEFKKIKEVYQRIKGTPITAGKMKEIQSPTGEIRIFAGGKTVIDANEADIPNANITRVPAVLVQSRGVIDAIYYDKPFTFKNEMWAYTHKEQASVKFLYYVMKQNIQHFRDAASGMGALPQISLGTTEDFEIPVPPLPIQEEIVRVLDTFTELQAELQAELQKRLQQYNFYRDNLLSFEGRSDVEWKKLGDVASIKTGRRFVRTDIRERGVPCFHYGDLYTYYGLTATQTKGYLDAELASKLRFAQPNDVVVVCAGENDMDIGVGVAWLGNEPAVVHDACCILHHDQNPRYISHFLRTHNYHLQMKKYVKNGKISSLPSSGLANALIPIPSLEEQERIATILDKFYALTTDITAGLPAEIEARRKQYEYYRDQLLTFKQKA
jgi:type I restriction enzyme S subunit